MSDAPSRSSANVIRAAVAEDAVTIADIHKELFDGAWNAAVLSKMITAPAALAYVAEGAGTVVGFVIATSVVDETEILSIGVTTGAQRTGIASRLLETLVEAVREGPPGRVQLEVAESNVAARALYDRLGFAVVGHRPGYYARAEGRREDALMLARPSGSESH